MKKHLLLTGMLLSSAMFAQVGVNTANPKATLDVISKKGDTKSFRVENSTQKEAVTVLDNGNVGVSMVTPQTPLHVKGSIRNDFSVTYPLTGGLSFFQTASNDGAGNYSMYWNTAGGTEPKYVSDGSAFQLAYNPFGTGNVIRGKGLMISFAEEGTAGQPLTWKSSMLWANNGNIMVGELPNGEYLPSAKLEISGKGDGVKVLRLATDRPWVFKQEGEGADAGLSLGTETAGKSFMIKNFSGDNMARFHSATEKANDAVILAETTGRVGIGTSKPMTGTKLDVAGNVRVSELAGESTSFVVVNSDGILMRGKEEFKVVHKMKQLESQIKALRELVNVLKGEPGSDGLNGSGFEVMTLKQALKDGRLQKKHGPLPNHKRLGIVCNNKKNQVITIVTPTHEFRCDGGRWHARGVIAMTPPKDNTLPEKPYLYIHNTWVVVAGQNLLYTDQPNIRVLPPHSLNHDHYVPGFVDQFDRVYFSQY